MKLRSKISVCELRIIGGQKFIKIRNPQSAIGNSSAFTLIEIMIVAVLLTVIVLGLLAMFQQTQKAFRVGMTQTDVLESGRATMHLITRDLEHIAASRNPSVVNFYTE